MSGDLFVVGTSHHIASLDVRERLAVSNAELSDTLAHMAALSQCDELVVISTCNRVEYYGVATEPAAAAETIRQQLEKKLSSNDSTPLYSHWGTSAARHLFRVSASLDSMVVGEPQILGQVKQAYRTAEQAEQVGPVLNRSFARSFSAASSFKILLATPALIKSNATSRSGLYSTKSAPTTWPGIT